MTTIFPTGLAEPPPPPERITVEQYHRMIEAGILEEGLPIELLDGYLVRKDRSASGEDPMTVGNHHMWVVNKLAELGAQLKALGCFISIQQPISAPPESEPEPDAAIIRGTADVYRERKPLPGDVLAVIEVADSSLRRDRSTKLAIYAGAGIEVYFIINLREGVIEKYTQPVGASGRYGKSETLTGRQTLVLPTAKTGLKVAVKSLLP